MVFYVFLWFWLLLSLFVSYAYGEAYHRLSYLLTGVVWMPFFCSSEIVWLSFYRLTAEVNECAVVCVSVWFGRYHAYHRFKWATKSEAKRNKLTMNYTWHVVSLWQKDTPIREMKWTWGQIQTDNKHQTPKKRRTAKNYAAIVTINGISAIARKTPTTQFVVLFSFQDI